MVVSSLATFFFMSRTWENAKIFKETRWFWDTGNRMRCLIPFGPADVVDLSHITHVHISFSKGWGTMRISPFSHFCNQAVVSTSLGFETCRSVQTRTTVRSEYWLKIEMRNLCQLFNVPSIRFVSTQLCVGHDQLDEPALSTAWGNHLNWRPPSQGGGSQEEKSMMLGHLLAEHHRWISMVF